MIHQLVLGVELSGFEIGLVCVTYLGLGSHVQRFAIGFVMMLACAMHLSLDNHVRGFVLVDFERVGQLLSLGKASMLGETPEFL